MKFSEDQIISVQGARVHNLRDIDVQIPREKLVVITGLSGSGKSSLAFDTIYAEGQRRYIETFSAYARQFLGSLERPDVDKIDGLSPVIAIEQKTTSKSPRSTVGTITEVYDFLRLLFARASDAYSYNTGEKMVSYTDEQIQERISERYLHKRISILAPVIRARKGHYRELFEQIAKRGFLKVRVDGVIMDIVKGMKLDRYKTHDIEIVIDRIAVSKDAATEKRLSESILTAMSEGSDLLLVLEQESQDIEFFSRDLMCPSTGISYPVPEPNSFSFNSPKGMCPKCNGLGHHYEISLDKVIPDEQLSIEEGGIEPLGKKRNTWAFKQLEAIALKYQFDLSTPIAKIPEQAMNIILYGGNESFEVFSKTAGVSKSYKIDYEGICNFIQSQSDDAHTSTLRRWAQNYMDKTFCTSCEGSRLQKEALFFKYQGKNIAELAAMDLVDLNEFILKSESNLKGDQKIIAQEILKEIKARLSFLLDVGLNYLSLNRSSKSLFGGEAQRIRLDAQIGSLLAGVLY